MGNQNLEGMENSWSDKPSPEVVNEQSQTNMQTSEQEYKKTSNRSISKERLNPKLSEHYKGSQSIKSNKSSRTRFKKRHEENVLLETLFRNRNPLLIAFLPTDGHYRSHYNLNIDYPRTCMRDCASDYDRMSCGISSSCRCSACMIDELGFYPSCASCCRECVKINKKYNNKRSNSISSQSRRYSCEPCLRPCRRRRRKRTQKCNRKQSSVKLASKSAACMECVDIS